MKVQDDNLACSSLMLYLDHVIANEGRGFKNVNTSIYSIDESYNNLYSYGLPFKQAIADSSVEGAIIFSGVYLNNNFTSIGQSSLSGINHYEGQVYFTSPVNQSSLRAQYAIKDFNIYMTNRSEQEVLFETAIKIRPKTHQKITGLAQFEDVVPAIYIKNMGGTSNPFALGGAKKLITEIRCIALTDNLYDLDALCSLLKEKANNYMPIITPENLKLNNLNSLPNGYFNYKSLSQQSNNSLYIDNIYISRNNFKAEHISHNVHSAFIDFSFSNIK